MSSIVLGSQSPRRQELLSKAGIKFSVRVPNVNEVRNPNESGPHMVSRLSKLKANAIADEFLKSPSATTKWIIAADTTVVSPAGEILEKPKNKKEAQKMVSSLAGKTHAVFTAYSIVKVVRSNVKLVCHRRVKTLVKFRSLTAKEIRSYIDVGESMDKAGAYAAQGAGMSLIESIRGSYTNVVGLPMAELICDLKKAGAV